MLNIHSLLVSFLCWRALQNRHFAALPGSIMCPHTFSNTARMTLCFIMYWTSAWRMNSSCTIGEQRSRTWWDPDSRRYMPQANMSEAVYNSRHFETAGVRSENFGCYDGNVIIWRKFCGGNPQQEFLPVEMLSGRCWIHLEILRRKSTAKISLVSSWLLHNCHSENFRSLKISSSQLKN